MNFKTIRNSRIRIFSFLLFVLTLAACTKDKTAELEKLKTELEDLKNQQRIVTQKIEKLNEELGLEYGEKTKVMSVSVETIAPAEFRHYIEVQGRLDGEENVDVQPEGMGGAVQTILVQTGQSVVKGQILAKLNDGAMQEQMKALKTQYELANENFERQKRLWDQKVGSEMQFLQAKSNKEALEGQLAALQEQIDMNSIKSPINGTVEEINIKVGQLSSPQMPIPAFRVVNFRTIKVKAEVAEAYSKKVTQGDPVDVMFPDLDKTIDSKISAVSRYINPTNRTFTVEVKLDPEKDSFKANMIAILKITDYKSDSAISLSVKYLQTDLAGDFVYVAEELGGKIAAKKAYINQGQSYNGIVEITEGLKSGDKIITTGYLDIEEGQTITY